MTTKTGKTRATRKSSREEELLKEIESLKQKLSSNPVESVQEEYVETKIALDELIDVMSLLPYVLNLSTLGNGKGKEIKFKQYGERKQVLYQDILGVLEYHRSFMEYGYFIILDERVIKRHGLQEIYSKILTKEKIDQILSGSSSAVSLYGICNPEQQKIVVGMLIDKLRDAPESIDLNVVDKIYRLSGVNITQKAEEARELMTKEAEE